MFAFCVSINGMLNQQLRIYLNNNGLYVLTMAFLVSATLLMNLRISIGEAIGCLSKETPQTRTTNRKPANTTSHHIITHTSVTSLIIIFKHSTKNLLIEQLFYFVSTIYKFSIVYILSSVVAHAVKLAINILIVCKKHMFLPAIFTMVQINSIDSSDSRGYTLLRY